MQSSIASMRRSVAMALLAVYTISLTLALAACGGGGDDEPDRQCVVEGKVMPAEACR